MNGAEVEVIPLPNLDSIPASHFPNVLTNAAVDIDRLTVIGSGSGNEDSYLDGGQNRLKGFDFDDLLQSGDEACIFQLEDGRSPKPNGLAELKKANRARPVSDGFKFRKRLNSLTAATGLGKPNASSANVKGKKRHSMMDYETQGRNLYPQDVDDIFPNTLPTNSRRDIDDVIVDEQLAQDNSLLAKRRLDDMGKSKSRVAETHFGKVALTSGMAINVAKWPLDVDSLLSLAANDHRDAGTAENPDEFPSSYAHRSHLWITCNWSQVDLAGREHGFNDPTFIYRPWTREGWRAGDIQGLVLLGDMDNTHEVPLGPDLTVDVQEIGVLGTNEFDMSPDAGRDGSPAQVKYSEASGSASSIPQAIAPGTYRKSRSMDIFLDNAVDTERTQARGASGLLLHHLSYPVLDSTQAIPPRIMRANSEATCLTRSGSKRARKGAEDESRILDALDIDTLLHFGTQPGKKGNAAKQIQAMRNVEPAFSYQDVADLVSIGESKAHLPELAHNKTLESVHMVPTKSNAYLEQKPAPTRNRPEGKTDEEEDPAPRNSQSALLRKEVKPAHPVLFPSSHSLKAFQTKASKSTPSLPSSSFQHHWNKPISGSMDNIFLRKRDDVVREISFNPTPLNIDIDDLVRLLELPKFEIMNRKGSGRPQHSPYSQQSSIIEHPNLQLRFLITDCPSDDTLTSDYLPLFQEQNVKVLIRLCDPAVYNPNPLIEAGIVVKDDLGFEDGSVPNQELVDTYRDFLAQVSANATPSSAAVAVHCISGIGRAPILAAIALIDTGLERLDVVELIRSKRRGAFNKRQLDWILDEKSGLAAKGKAKKKLFGGLFKKK
ncbi:Protein tyrosine phosphatase prl-1 [Phlyctochytrium planicorne]|nr:Protein tyrosine phosphatase prl-1 [Phlyctochytrium planicorne]